MVLRGSREGVHRERQLIHITLTTGFVNNPKFAQFAGGASDEAEPPPPAASSLAERKHTKSSASNSFCGNI